MIVEPCNCIHNLIHDGYPFYHSMPIKLSNLHQTSTNTLEIFQDPWTLGLQSTLFRSGHHDAPAGIGGGCERTGLGGELCTDAPWIALVNDMGKLSRHRHFEGSPMYPLVNIQKAIENCPFIVDLPTKNGDFP